MSQEIDIHSKYHKFRTQIGLFCVEFGGSGTAKKKGVRNVCEKGKKKLPGVTCLHGKVLRFRAFFVPRIKFNIMRRVLFAEGEYYHLYNRGVDRRVVFGTKEDHDRFQAYLYILNDAHNNRATSYFISKQRREDLFNDTRIEPLVAIGAYCMMPNHFHILATPLVENGIPKFMHKLQTAYTMYFNEKMTRTGSLFQGTYKSEHVDDDVYLKYLYAYIHLNPAKLLTDDWHKASAGELQQLGSKILSYPYSSAGEYNLQKFVISNPKPFPKYFSNTKDMRGHLQFWLKYKASFTHEDLIRG